MKIGYLLQCANRRQIRSGELRAIPHVANMGPEPLWKRRSGRDWSKLRRFQADLSEPLVSFSEPQTSQENKLRVVEAVLLIAREPISARRLASLAELEDPTQARSVARALNEHYDAHGYAFRIEEVAGGLKLLTRPQFANWIRRLDVPGEVLLSQGMLETLAIIAYRQPVLRAEIEAIRGVNCDEVLRQLMQRDLVRISGRTEELGRPYLYGTTRRFLELFGLQSLDNLPRALKIKQEETEIASRLACDTSDAQDMGA